MVHGKWVQGNLIFYDTNRKRILDAWGPNVIKWELPRVDLPLDDTTNYPTGTTTTLVGASVAIVGGITQGVGMKMTTAATDYAGANMQWLGLPFALAANKPTYFGCKIAIASATSTDLFVGLAGTDTTITAGAAAHALNVSSAVGFYKIAAATATKCFTDKAGTSSSTSASSAMTTNARVYEWYYDGNPTAASATIEYFIDGSNVATHSTFAGIPTAVMRPSLNFRTGKSVAAIANVHWMRAIQLST